MFMNCPTCGHSTSADWQPEFVGVYRVRCAACGNYTLTYEAADKAGAGIGRLAPFTREASDAATNADEGLEITAANVGELLRRYEAISVGSKGLKLLQLIASRGPEPGTKADFNAFYDFPLVGAASPDELMYLVRHAIDEARLALNEPVDWQSFRAGSLTLTPTGWETLSPMAGGLPGTCFVAMWFDASLHEAYSAGIKPALEADCGYTVLQMSEHEHNNSITDEMLVQIRNAEFLVADVTGQRPNVYFEAGFALALGRPVIWSCREAEADAIHFDTRQFSHLLWRTPADLRRLLAARVKATIQARRTR